MHGFCDSCEESSDTLFDLTRLSEFRDVVRRLNYRKVCQICYDDLYEEIKSQKQVETGDDRRVETRYRINMPIQIAGVNREGLKFSEQAFTEDVSLTGTRIHTRQDLEVGSVLMLNVPDFGFEAAVIIELIWQDGDDLTAGLKLVEANDSWTKLITEQAVSLGK